MPRAAAGLRARSADATDMTGGTEGGRGGTGRTPDDCRSGKILSGETLSRGTGREARAFYGATPRPARVSGLAARGHAAQIPDIGGAGLSSAPAAGRTRPQGRIAPR